MTPAEKIIMLGISIFIFALLSPIAMEQINLVNMTGWGSSTVRTLFVVAFPIIGIIVIAIVFLPRGKKRRR